MIAKISNQLNEKHKGNDNRNKAYAELNCYQINEEIFCFCLPNELAGLQQFWWDHSF